MRLSRLVMPVLLVGLVACAGGDDDDTIVMEGMADSMAMEPAPMPEAGMDQPPGGIGQTTQFAALSGSGVGGEVTVGDRGAQSEIMVRLTGAPANSEHPGHIHSGRCDALGGVVQPLERITTDATGTGSMTTQVEMAPAMVMNGQHIVLYHGSGGSPVTCADIPQHTM